MRSPRRKRPTPGPIKPVYADQKWHGLPWSFRAKLLATLVVLAVVALGVYLLWLVSNIASHRETTQQQHNSVVREQLRERGDLRQLACLLVRDTPPGDDLGDTIRVKYDCPAFSNRSRNGSAPPPGSPSAPTGTTLPTPSPTQTEGLSRTLPGESGPTHTRTTTPIQSPSAVRSASPRATRTVTSTPATPKPTHSGLCSLPIVTSACSIIGG